MERMFHARLFLGDVEAGSRFVLVVDIDDPAAVKAQLNAHLQGAVERAGAHRDHAHRYHLDLHTVLGWSDVADDVFLRWVLPLEAS